MHTSEVTGEVVDGAIKVHRVMGPGLLESAYEACLCAELRRRGLGVETQVKLPVTYLEQRIDLGYRIDMLVEEELIVEIKAVAKLLDVHHAQLLSYLRFSGRRYGLLLNFQTKLMRDGIVRIANGW